jgi:hypothetical protein
MPRFVLLYHICPSGYERPSHWDLMLEVGDTLHTWALSELLRVWHAAQRATAVIDPACPPLAACDHVAAERLGNHRPVYLEYEGPLSGDRGQVHRIDSGTYVGEPTSPQVWPFELHGDMVHGTIVLQQPSTVNEEWILREN